jgi:hypothetical protein
VSEDRLASAYTTYARLLRENAAARELTPVPPAPPVPPVPLEVDIRTLCYRGRAALERADWVRRSLASQLGPGSDLNAAEPLIRELIDLVPLALEAAD